VEGVRGKCAGPIDVSVHHLLGASAV